MSGPVDRRHALLTLGGSGLGLLVAGCGGGGGGDHRGSPKGEERFTRGLHEVAEGVWAYLQPDGGWGLANAGLVTGGDESLLVDTLFDLTLTGEMLDTMRRKAAASERIGTVVNTHANGDHWFGNVLVAEAEIVAATACAEEMAQIPPSVLAGLVEAAADLGDAGIFLERAFGEFEFTGIEPALPTRIFTGSLDLQVGDRTVQLVEVGPAHTRGDVVVHLPDDGVVFTGDILFNDIHPIVWAGPVTNWIAACDTLLALDGVETFVPGHGPLAVRQDLVDLRDYFDYLVQEVTTRRDVGMSPIDTARDIDLGPYADWGDPERLVVNVNAIYHDLGSDVPHDYVALFGQMAAMQQ